MNEPIRVIIANDQEAVAKMWQRVVDKQDDMESPVCAYNGDQAVELASEYHPHVIVMDVMMPGMDGIEATRHIMQQGNGTRVIICSARPDIKGDAFAAGAVEVLAMPLLPDVLLDTIRQVVR